MILSIFTKYGIIYKVHCVCDQLQLLICGNFFYKTTKNVFIVKCFHYCIEI